MRGAFIVYYE